MINVDSHIADLRTSVAKVVEENCKIVNENFNDWLYERLLVYKRKFRITAKRNYSVIVSVGDLMDNLNQLAGVFSVELTRIHTLQMRAILYVDKNVLDNPILFRELTKEVETIKEFLPLRFELGVKYRAKEQNTQITNALYVPLLRTDVPIAPIAKPEYIVKACGTQVPFYVSNAKKLTAHKDEAKVFSSVEEVDEFCGDLLSNCGGQIFDKNTGRFINWVN